MLYTVGMVFCCLFSSIMIYSGGLRPMASWSFNLGINFAQHGRLMFGGHGRPASAPIA